MNPLNNLRMELKEALTNMWNRISARIAAIEQGGGTRSAPAIQGASGSFTSSDGKTVTVTNGVVTAINNEERR